METKSYIIVTDANYWAATLYHITEDELRTEIEDMKREQRGYIKGEMFIVYEIKPEPVFEIPIN